MRVSLILVPLALLMGVCMAQEMPKTAPTREQTAAVEKQGRYLATITMENGGVIELVLEGEATPYTTANFVQLAQAKYYDGVTFHRREEGFVIQGGDPKGNGSGGPGYLINLEIDPFMRHYRGAVSMARTPEPDTAGSQFFLCLGEANFLDGKYAAFGWVKTGMEVADKVKVGDKMKTVTVAPYAGTEVCPLLQK
jgi:peptidyl-prolyl cis-trans isomerase B (cyclophilin B)